MSTLLWIVFITIPALPNLWCIWHAYHHEFDSPVTRIIWIMVGIFIPVIGGIAYFFFGRPKAKKAINKISN
ncbi:PLDc N-terminal domain-containing protein [Desulfovibrio litoralis]|uniref:Phospholipase_D-nuclease N-terminal n=1 Tax=Desulfovibrio litoralis DSM 11393 TaxID=1121455 RepID=A0A1M7S7S4_9BACT|nr:PLDc N-terminal domain-containing protein [Desulfovibrio litoralis]SHN54516.1 Phospholipase_D-nuclease N-terminal [Desulfovibrio litoralis DSM 11393]